MDRDVPDPARWHGGSGRQNHGAKHKAHTAVRWFRAKEVPARMPANKDRSSNATLETSTMATRCSFPSRFCLKDDFPLHTPIKRETVLTRCQSNSESK
jgi:hypothetical protein